MPLHSTHTIQAGTRARLILLCARDLHERARAKTGLAHSSRGATAAFIREGDRAAVVSLIEGQVGTSTQGGLVEVDPNLVPGV